jgi:hypothetical protein
MEQAKGAYAIIEAGRDRGMKGGSSRSRMIVRNRQTLHDDYNRRQYSYPILSPGGGPFV